jgi:hypothetical protein
MLADPRARETPAAVHLNLDETVSVISCWMTDYPILLFARLFGSYISRRRVPLNLPVGLQFEGMSSESVLAVVLGGHRSEHVALAAGIAPLARLLSSSKVRDHCVHRGPGKPAGREIISPARHWRSDVEVEPDSYDVSC